MAHPFLLIVTSFAVLLFWRKINMTHEHRYPPDFGEIAQRETIDLASANLDDAPASKGTRYTVGIEKDLEERLAVIQRIERKTVTDIINDALRIYTGIALNRETNGRNPAYAEVRAFCIQAGLRDEQGVAIAVRILGRLAKEGLIERLSKHLAQPRYRADSLQGTVSRAVEEWINANT